LFIMNRIKYLLIMVCIAGCFAACKKDTPAFDEVAQFSADTTAIRAYIKEKGLTFLKNEKYGIFYQITNPGTGNVTYNGLTQVTASYEGRFLSGVAFDSSTSASFPLQNVIPAWQFAVPQIQKGGSIRFISPSFYGYRNVANERIPANSILDFTVTVIDLQ